jgi:hypothetical protein
MKAALCAAFFRSGLCRIYAKFVRMSAVVLSGGLTMKVKKGEF